MTTSSSSPLTLKLKDRARTASAPHTATDTKLAAMGSDSNKSARRASKLNFAHIDCLCSMDLWDHGDAEGALVGNFWP